jgi:hypothetical protein
MFVLLGPDFEGTSEAYQRLAQVTGLVAYDLRARIRPGTWGVVKSIADEDVAHALADALRAAQFRPVLVEREVAYDADRRIVPVRGIALGERDLTLQLRDREMTVEYAALACIVRGEVQPGRVAQGSSIAPGPSSGSFRAAGVSTEPQSARELQQSPFDAYQAADLHFLTATWIARMDVRALATDTGETSPRLLDATVDEIARRANVRVDRGIRSSSVVSLAEQPSPMRFQSEPPSVREIRREPPDQRFDPYSRLIGEAERLVQLHAV